MTIAEPLERCDQCGFDSALWHDQDTVRTITPLAALARLWTERVDAALANRRIDDATWSIAEYLWHVGDVLAVNRARMQLALDQPGFVIADPVAAPDPGPHRRYAIDDAVRRIDEAASAMVTLLNSTPREDWTKAIVVGGDTLNVRWASRHVVHDAWHHLVDIAELRHDLGDRPLTQHGTVERINASDGGVPKRELTGAVAIGRRGLVGDRQATRFHHGRPWQALCLWSGDVIDELQGEGHPVRAGDTGENLTLRDVDWSQLRAGLTVEIGDVVARLTADALPCTKISAWFADANQRRIDHAQHPGWSRWYAEVLHPGTIATGDRVRIGTRLTSSRQTGSGRTV